MTSDVEIARALAAITATINDEGMDDFDTERVQSIVTESVGGEPRLAVDDGGGLHDEAGARVGAIRRTPSGEWIAERQNETADRADTAIPARPPQARTGLLGKLKGLGS